MRIRVLDMFCGAGGSSPGARMAGASVVHCIDQWVFAAQTFQDNFCDAKVDIRELGPDNCPPCSLRRGDIEMLFPSRNAPFTVLRRFCAAQRGSRRTSNYVLNFTRKHAPRWHHERTGEDGSLFPGRSRHALEHGTPPNQAMLVSSPHALSV